MKLWVVGVSDATLCKCFTPPKWRIWKPKTDPMKAVLCSKVTIWGFPKIRGTFVGVPHSKDYNMLESILGSPYFGKLLYGVKGHIFVCVCEWTC